jgi:outer membrane immunogenic protein
MGLLMRRLSLAIIAAVSTIALTQIASAADLPRKAPAYTPPAPAVYSWTGFYIGANIGGGWGDRNVTYTPNDPAAAGFFPIFGVGSPTSFRIDGVIGGAQLGYNWQFHPNWLVGLETDFDGSGMKGSSSVPTNVGGVAGLMSVDEHIKWFGTVRGRLGWLPLANLLVYGTGGFAYGRVEHTGNYTLGAVPAGPIIVGGVAGGFSWDCELGGVSPCFAGASNRTATGWTAGGGIEYALWQHWSLRAEYLYVNLTNKPLTETAQALGAPGTAPASFNANFNRAGFNVVRLGLNYQFH